MIARVLFICALMLGAAIGAAVVDRAPQKPAAAPDLEAFIPDAFGDWESLELTAAVLPAEAELGPGEAVHYRSFQDKAGRVVTLVVAYGPPLGDSVRLHRPESCYVAQGFTVYDRSVEQYLLAGETLDLVRLDTGKSLRKEAVSYWLRDGNDYVTSAPGHQLLFFKRGLSSPADAALIRISSQGEGAQEYQIHDDFMDAFAGVLSEEAKELLFAGMQ